MQGQRLWRLIRKEFIQIVRDPSAIAIAFVMPVMLLFLFGYGVSLDARHVPVAVVVDAPNAETAQFVARLQQSPYVAPRFYHDRGQAEQAVMAHRVAGILRLRSDFGARMLRGESAQIGVEVNGVDANTARILEGYVQGAWQTWMVLRQQGKGQTLVLPVTPDTRIWFNPAVRSRDYLVPGLIAVIMTLIGALLTALVVAREWERGTMEALMATPVTMSEILLGKLIPYFVLGMGGMILSVALARWLFDVHMVGHFMVLLLLSALFLLVALGMGLLISSVARNQFVASQVAVIVTFLPAFLMSGFIFDIHSMPAPIRFITHAVAARYFVAILQTEFLVGDQKAVLLTNGLSLLAMAFIFLGLTWYRSRKRLD